MRVTIGSKANQKFIKQLATNWDMSEKESLEHLITTIRLGQFNGFNSTTVQTLPTYDSILEQQPQANYQETASEEFETDEVIQRLIALGVTEQF